jgi:alkylhydroperoxidase/carboxymuconolactone decarboxylase family protein YurZ
MTLAPDLQALKDETLRLRGYWHRFHDGLLAWSPAFLRAYLGFQSAPWRSNHLEPKVREFIYIAVDSAVTHLYPSGLRRHIDDALALGATPGEVLQVVLLTASAAAHATHELGLAILAEEMPRALAAATDPKDASRRDAYVASTGSWSPVGDAVLALAPDFAEGFLGYRQSAWEAGPLPDRIKALILLAYHASPATLNREGTRLYMREAIRFGASAGEIAEVLQLASAIAVHTCTYGVPALMDAVAELEKKKASGT